MVDVVIKLPKMDSKLEKHIVKGLEISAKAEIARILMLEKLDRLLSKSRFNEKDALELGRITKKGRFEKLSEMGLL